MTRTCSYAHTMSLQPHEAIIIISARRHLVQAYQGKEITTEELRILQTEAQIYKQRRADRYSSEYALDQDRLGVGLGSIVEAYCRVNERPFPNRHEDDLTYQLY